MVTGTRIDPEEHEPRAIKIGGKKQKNNKKKIILSIVAAICVFAAGIFAFMMFGDSIELPKLPFGGGEESSSQSESIPEESGESSSFEESEPESSVSSSSLPESSAAESESSGESSSEEIIEVEPEGPAWYEILVNAENPLPEDYTVETAAIDNEGHSVDARIYADLSAMIAAGESEGLDFIFYTAYRSVEKQKELYEAGKTTAAPGTSEHNSGLAVDIGSATNADFLGSAEEAWLLEHAHEYGFILRYPKDKENVTGFTYEPWHFRYVGKTLAEHMIKNNLCLEEVKFE